MIIKFNSLAASENQYCKKNSFLFYGPNFGKLDSASNHILNSKKREINDYETIHIYTEELKKGDFLKIYRSAIEPNLFGLPKAYIISLTSEKHNKEIISFLDCANENCLIIIKSEQLPPKSSLRMFCEKSNDSIVVPCYEETNFEKNQLISNCFKKEDINITEIDIQNISDLLPDERSSIIQEIEKLLIVLKSNRVKNFDNSFFAYLSEFTNGDLTRFINKVCLGEIRSFTKEFNTVTDFGKDNIKLMTLMTDHLFKILIVKQKIREGHTLRDAVATLKPKIFFKYLDSFNKQVSKFKEDQLYNCIKRLYFCRKSILTGELSGHHLFLITIINLFFLRKS